MSATELVFRFIAAGSLVTAVTLLAKTKYTTASGVLMLFPAVTLVVFYYTQNYLSIPKSLLLSIIAWFASATAIVGLIKV